MDIFKFRVFNKIENKYVDTFSDAHNKICRYYIDQNGDLVSIEEGEVVRVQDKENFIVERCTGRHDKNGKLMFAGDVVRTATGAIGVVMFYEDLSSFIVKFEDTQIIQMCNIVETQEVIGNIHEIEKENVKNEELKPCPFCGGKAVLVRLGERDDYYVVCEDCIVCTDYMSKEKVINVWNSRARDE